MQEYIIFGIQSIFVLNLLFIIVLFIGWLTHANYYYKLINKVPDVILFCYFMPSALISFMGVLGYIGNQPDIFKGAVLFSAMLFGFALLMTAMFSVIYGIIKIHNHFGNKRGIK